MSTSIPDIHVPAFRYHLPENRIPDRPLADRDQSKLLVYKQGEIEESVFSYLPMCLPKEALLVFNNSKVIPARLHFFTPNGAQIEVLCLNPLGMETKTVEGRAQRWKCMVGNLKRWKEGVLLESLFSIDGAEGKLQVQLEYRAGEENEVRFCWDMDISFFEVLEHLGEIPLPPYMNRKADAADKKNYQTVYAAEPGSVAAPTAGLHFTPKVMDELSRLGVESQNVTLHVGAGTFKPIKSEKAATHTMHEEFFEVGVETVSMLTNKDMIVPVGTTSMRTLESLYHLGCQLVNGNTEMHVPQWSGFAGHDLSKQEAMHAILVWMEKHAIAKLVASTSIMIVPGYKFKMCKGLVTNFHQPESTLILLVAAFIGQDWQKVYDHALAHDFRFLSYGDSSLLLP
jgi:S-adenosylmethionine:tRNA ribosyltransferase-isomerase